MGLLANMTGSKRLIKFELPYLRETTYYLWSNTIT